MENKKKSKKKNEIWEWTKALLIAVVLAVVIRSFLFEPVVVNGQSMMPTLHNQDRLILNKISKPKRFDIIVFHATKTDNYVKRVIGLPGDRIEYKNDTLYINGKAYKEPYLAPYKKMYKEQYGNNTLLTENFKLKDVIGRDTVPKGTVFVLGDNRRNSRDSRMIGVVPMDKIIGKANVLFWPLSDFKFIK
ncbi:signal peptidase I [Bacillus ginsengihumi]|uniref:Signal peptidase I n=1 Tax=Heyndrickxia ginsengihumi TaxID=363870 RepID=A0A6M0P5A6_9BACI|nr:signal peptidase I [Heyndrickxia ginsengihumi]MBE6182895.1 signal peptidase I [Bacillus sp. (in: firmicutes)]MCM3023913.1 signal peptidase I [Heyndrickxia ginsengihumi]NEY19886.1 signal peptidase I [Heyndrickxia ginsengihumi]